jgi:hypothetical protein
MALEGGYKKVLQRLGRNLVEFLTNLNNLHLHLSLGMPIMPPDFRVEKVWDRGCVRRPSPLNPLISLVPSLLLPHSSAGLLLLP